ncbi:barstar family protein [Sphingomonas koreensis]
MRLELDGSAIRSSADFHNAVKAASEISFYGKNLDALWDLLTGLVERPVRITWTNAKQSQLAMGDDFSRILGVINDALLFYEKDDFMLEISN